MGIGHHHGEQDGGQAFRTLWLVVAVGLCMLLSATGVLTHVAGIPLNAIAAVVGGLPVLTAALRELLHLRLSADLAVCLAAGAAIAIGEHFVAAEVILIMLIGGVLEDLAVHRTRGAIRALIALSPREATVLRHGGQQERLPIAQVAPGDTVLVSPGERVPVDGRVRAGASAVDQSPITGESLPVDVSSGQSVLAGSVNGAGVLEVTTEKVGPDTAFGRMVHLVEEAEKSKAPTQRLADRFATFFLPVVLACAGATYVVSGELVRAVTVLVIACPCALVLATPTAVSAGIGRLARRGILVKGGAALEALGRSRSILLDKTGTLTLAQLVVADVVPADGVDQAHLLRVAAAVESGSEHPVGRAILKEAEHRRLDVQRARDITAIPGGGIRGSADGKLVLVGSRALVAEHAVSVPEAILSTAEALQAEGKAVAFVAEGDRLLGLVSARDQARPEACEAVTRLLELFPAGVCMLTGDTAGAAGTLSEEIGITDVRSGLLPEDKTRIVQEFSRDRGPVTMVGDGVNDAAALTVADVGIALTDVGTDVAIEAAGIAIFGERHLEKLPEAVLLARRVLRTIRQNIILFALGLNSLGVITAAMGWFGPVAAALLHQVGSLFVVCNSLRLLVSGEDVTRGARTGLTRLRTGILGLRRPAMAALPVLYVLSGVYIVAPDQVGVVRRFGQVVRPVAGPGLHYRLPAPMTKLDRLTPSRTERMEIGFRTEGTGVSEAPPAYEWNIQHRGGRYQMVPEESLMTCGDQGFLDLNTVLHYRVTDPVRFLFAARDSRQVLRCVAESSLRAIIAETPLTDILTNGRADLETRARNDTAEAVGRYDIGVEICRVSLQDVHPPLAVVDAFRQVVDALEQKDAAVNRAQAYLNEQIPLGRGEAAGIRSRGEAESAALTAQATGGAGRFELITEGRSLDTAPDQVTDFHLYMETMEAALTRPRLLLLDSSLPGRRGLVLVGAGSLTESRGGTSLEQAVTTPDFGEDTAPRAPAGGRPAGPGQKELE